MRSRYLFFIREIVTDTRHYGIYSIESANGGITKTKLFALTNLTSEQLRQYLGILLTEKAVVYLADADGRDWLCQTTERGITHLSIFWPPKSIAVFQQD